MARKVPEINSASMADISFMLLIFFLVTTTMDVDSGIYRKLPQWVDSEQEPPQDIKKRNTFVVLISRSNSILVNGQYMPIRELKTAVKDFILNPGNLDNLSEKEEVDVPLVGTIMRSKGLISLQNDRGTDYGEYIKVQNELVAAFNEMRHDFSMVYFGMKYDMLNEEKQEAVQKAIPAPISEAEPVEIK